MVHLKPERVKHAINSIQQWYTSTQPQAAKHIIPLLALLEAGAGNMSEVRLEETDKDDHPPNDYNFWDRYLRIDDASDKPYFNFLTLKRGTKTYPHSNAATIRKRTFLASWHAVELREDGENSYWTLADDYAEIFRTKALTKAGNLFKIPVLDLGIALFRTDEFPDGSTATTIVDKFRQTFSQRDPDFQQIFDFKEEPAQYLFTSDPVNVPGDYDAVLLAALISDEANPEDQEPVPAISKLEDADDHILIQVQQLLRLGTSGIIFSGPPGTGKTYYAQRVAASIVADVDQDIFRVQFHPSFGYEDFIEGYRPSEDKKSGFGVVDKLFLTACRRAKEVSSYVVFIIDEINRGDPARVFGELLTYIEHSYREKTFLLPFSGDKASIPRNLLLLGTMNPQDRSVAHIDAAFIRRFDHIELDPSHEVVREMIGGGSFAPDQIEHIARWFETAQKMLPIGLGHSFFKGVHDIDILKLVWRYRIRPTANTILEYDPSMRANFERSFEALIRRLEGVDGEA